MAMLPNTRMARAALPRTVWTVCVLKRTNVMPLSDSIQHASLLG